MVIPDLLTRQPGRVGEQLARYVFGVWENPATRGPLLAIMRSASTTRRRRRSSANLIGRNLLQRVAGGLDVPDAVLRVELAIAQMIGIGDAALRDQGGADRLANR